MFVCLIGVYRPTRDFSLTWRRLHCRWRAANFDLCSALLAIERCHTHCDTGLLVISEDPWHSHLLPSVWQWSCHYLFLRLRSVSTGDRIRFSDIKKSYLLSETKQSVFNVKIFLFLDIRKSNKNCIIKKLNVLYQGST